MTRIPSDRLIHIGVVVKDAKASARKFAKLYGIAEWKVVNHGPERLSEVHTQGYASPHSFVTATGTAPTANGPVTFRLVQPTGGWSTYQEFLLTRGEGVHSICTAVVEPGELEALLPALAADGVKVGQSGCVDGKLDYHLLDTRHELGGFFIEILSPRQPGAVEAIAPDETWDLSSEVPAGGALLPVTDFRHFGVVVRDLMERVQSWTKFFGTTEWMFRNWRTEKGSLEDPTYLGKPVNHAYFTTMVTVGKLLTFEIIQPTFGPSHYKEDYLNHIGEGVHHVFTAALDSKADWDATVGRMSEIGVPVVMSGGLGDDFAHFYYLDTREAAAGYVTEALHPGANRVEGQRPNFEVAMTADLSSPTR